MKHTTRQQRISTAKGEPMEVITSRPTVAGSLPKKMEHKFRPAASIGQAEFIRLPEAGGRCPLTGLSRSGLCAVATAAGAYISARLPGRVRGAVLLDRKKLVEYLRTLARKEDEV